MPNKRIGVPTLGVEKQLAMIRDEQENLKDIVQSLHATTAKRRSWIIRSWAILTGKAYK